MESGTSQKSKKRKKRSIPRNHPNRIKCEDQPLNSNTHHSLSSLSSTAEKMDQVKTSKSLLHEYAQKKRYATPKYVSHEDGEGSQRTFTAQVWINGVTFTGVPAETQKLAEQNAAKKACNMLRIDSKFLKSKEKLGQVTGKLGRNGKGEKDEEVRRLRRVNEEQEMQIMAMKKELSERTTEYKSNEDRVHNLEKDLKAAEDLLADRDIEVGLLKDRLGFMDAQIENLSRRFTSSR